ncbi:GGDEF domain-containing protein [Stieleria sp. JC731]|uniref:sensor domain-containing diguanylate cyclase n=1 Tax=Pirellulaceae TaxID=2691357 RepID=UPI001E537EE6|nr:GGDEF domain-containing protein [Stieleria sp. JC731]MCC9600348.1 GGDEF domain-containing protein [Stieleria sp. JC731]
MKPELAKIIESQEMPSPPTVAAELLLLAGQPDVKIDEIAQVISADPALAAKLIDYCNSPMVMANRKISSLHQAVTLMGIRTVRMLSLSFSLMDARGAAGFPYEEFWRHSLGMAIAAKRLAIVCGGDEDESFLMGLVYNIGVMGLGICFSDAYEQRFTKKYLLTELSVRIERDISGTDRYELGACLLDHWNFPETMVKTLEERRFHLDQPRCIYGCAEKLARVMLARDTDLRDVVDVRKEVCAIFSLSESQFDKIFDGILEDWRNYESLFNFETIAFESLRELETRAKRSMVEISMNMERTIREMSQQHDELRQLAWIDALTQLKNRTAFDNEVQDASRTYLQNSQSFGLMIADIDHFKSFNDTFGHSAGDCVLREVGCCLKRNLRKADHVYRFGGEEFVLLVSNCDFEQTMRVGERLRSSIQDLRVSYEDYELCVTVSMGICWVNQGQHNSFEELFEAADSCLFEAKRKGRNNCVAAMANGTSAPMMVEATSGSAPLILDALATPNVNRIAATHLR